MALTISLMNNDYLEIEENEKEIESNRQASIYSRFRLSIDKAINIANVIDDVDDSDPLNHYGFDSGIAASRCIPLHPATKTWLHSILHNLYFRLSIFFVIIIDLIILILEFTGQDEHLDMEVLRYITWAILFILAIEVCVRIIYMDIVPFFSTVWCCFDFFISIGSFITSAVDEYDQGRYIVVLRIVRYLRFIRVLWKSYLEPHIFKAATRQFVSQNRRRYQQNGFDIDITYVTSRIIAMSVPATKFESFYRNPISEVVRFFDSKHRQQYLIFNLCPERRYPYTDFDSGSVIESFMGDHNPAPLYQLLKNCQDIQNWLISNKTNVVAIHCKGGKGRTGTVLCCYLIYAQIFTNADLALDFFARQRTSDDYAEKGKREGVEARSQTRYVNYFACMCENARRSMLDDGNLVIQGGDVSNSQNPNIRKNVQYYMNKAIHTDTALLSKILLPPKVAFMLTRVRIVGTSYLLSSQKSGLKGGIRCLIHQDLDTVMHDADFCVVSGDYADFEIKKNGLVGIRVCDDIRIAFYSTDVKKIKKGKKQKALFSFWFNTCIEAQLAAKNVDLSIGPSHVLSSTAQQMSENTSDNKRLPSEATMILTFTKDQIDGIRKCKDKLRFPSHFKVELTMKLIE